MSSTTISEPPGFSGLSKAEQVRYLLAFGDQIAYAPEEIPVPDGHLELAEARLKDYLNDPTSSHFAFDVLDRLAEKSK